MQTNINEFTMELKEDIDLHMVKYIDRVFNIPFKYIFTTEKRKRKLKHRAKLVKHVFWLVDRKYKIEGFQSVESLRKPIYVGHRFHKYEYYVKFRKIG